MALGENAKGLLSANGVIPLNENNWLHHHSAIQTSILILGNLGNSFPVMDCSGGMATS